MVKNILINPGGKGNLYPKIKPYLLYHMPVYVEPYVGGGGSFINKPKSLIEIINDIDPNIIKVYQSLQDESIFQDLKQRLLFTLYSREEFEAAKKTTQDAYTIIISSRMSCTAIASHGARL